MAQFRVKAVTVDKKKATLFMDDGTTKVIDQGDYRIAQVVDQIMPVIAKGEIAIVDLENFSVYADFQKKSTGFARFFKVAKDKIKHIFHLGSDEHRVEPKEEASVSSDTAPSTNLYDKVQEAAKPAAPSVEEILDGAKDPDDGKLGADETIVAVTENGNVIPEMEKLQDQFIYANTKGSTIGMENFLKRIEANINQYGHSVKDVIRFMEKGDLPVADDGCILAYKLLNRTSEPGVFVDIHSGRVFQKVGSYVEVLPELVDRNRGTECSNGLHIARRAYLAGFSGNVVVLVKLPPENIVTVPHNDPNKVRVMGYHIIDELPQAAYDAVKRNMPMTKIKEVAQQLADAIKGNHIGRIEQVLIQGQKGTNLKITPLIDGVPAKVNRGTDVAHALDDDKGGPAKVDPKEVNKRYEEEKAKAVEPKKPAPVTEPVKTETVNKPLTNAEKARQAFDVGNYITVQQIKKTAKVSYEKLGFSPDEIIKIGEKATVAAKPAAEKVNEPVKAKETVNKTSSAKKQSAPVAQESKANPVFGSKKEEARYLFNAQRWEELVTLKKTTKVSYAKLGLSEAEEETLLNNLFKGDSRITKIEKLEPPKPSMPNLEGMSNAQKVRALYDHWIVTNDAQSLGRLLSTKGKAKVSWEKLGLNQAEVDQINKTK